MNLAQELVFRRLIAKLAGERLRRRKIPVKRASARPRLEYQTLLRQMAQTRDRLLRELILPELEEWRRQSATERGIRLDAVEDDILRVFSNFRVLFANAHPLPVIESKLEDIAEITSQDTADAFQAQMKAGFGVELITPARGVPVQIERFISRNLDLITSLHDERLLYVSDIIQRGVTAGVRVEAIRDEILHATGVSTSKASLLARDQTLKLHGQLTQTRQQGAGIKTYFWDSSSDERVRPRHRELHGTLQRWDDPPIVDPRTGRRAHPGQDYQCRCNAIPNTDELLDEIGV